MDELQELALNKQLRTALIAAGYKDIQVTQIGGDIIYTNEKIKQSYKHTTKKSSQLKFQLKIEVINPNI